jgi:hypothetical protein
MASSASARAHGYAPQGEAYQATRNGTVTFAAVLLFVLAFFNGLDGIAAINRSSVFVSGAHYVLGDLRAWGWVMLALGIVQAIAAFSVLRGGQIGRWFGVAVLAFNAFAHMWFALAFPFWSVVIIALDILAIWALCAYGGPLTEEAPAGYERTFEQPGGPARQP